MDEGTGGVEQKSIPGLSDLVCARRESGITALTIEHNRKGMMQISDRILALQSGIRIAFAKPDKVRKDPLVVDAYLGTVDAA